MDNPKKNNLISKSSKETQDKQTNSKTKANVKFAMYSRVLKAG